MAAIAYKVDEAARVGVTLEFIGSQAETHLTLRIGIKSSLGEIYFNPDFIDSDTNTISVTESYNLAAGDTLYFIFLNENPDANPSGVLSVTLVKEADSGHVLTKVDEVAPTCTTSGTAAYYTCSHCDKKFADANANREIDAPVTTTDALGHDTDGVNWTAEGDVHYKECRRCVAHIDEAAHSGGTASCEAKAVCEVCGAEYGEVAAHVFDQEVADAKYLVSEATCTAKAVYYKSCVCLSSTVK